MAGQDTEAAQGESLLVNSSNKRSLQPVAIGDWRWGGARVPKNQVTYMTQVVLVFGIIAVSLSQLILQSAERELCLILLSTSVGYVLPSPRLRFLKPKISITSSADNTHMPTSPSSALLPFPSTITADEIDSREIPGDSA